MGALLFVKVPLWVGYIVIINKVIVPVIEGTVEGIITGVRDVKAESKKNKDNEEN